MQHAPHLMQGAHAQVLGQVMQDQAGNHDVEVVARELQRFSDADLELAVAP